MTAPVQWGVTTATCSTGISSGVASNILPANATIGNTVLLALSTYPGAANDISSVSTTFGTATKVNSAFGTTNGDVEFWIVPVTAAGRSVTVTSGTASAWWGLALEYQGTASSVYSAASASSGLVSSAPITVTPTNPTDVMVVLVDTAAYSSDPSSNTPAWSVFNSGAAFTGTCGWGVAAYTAPSTSSVTATWTFTSGTHHYTAVGVGLVGLGRFIPPLVISQAVKRASFY